TEGASTQIAELQFVQQIGGMVYAASGEWDKAEQILIKAIENAKTTGDLRAFEESSVILIHLFIHLFSIILKHTSRFFLQMSIILKEKFLKVLQHSKKY